MIRRRPEYESERIVFFFQFYRRAAGHVAGHGDDCCPPCLGANQ